MQLAKHAFEFGVQAGDAFAEFFFLACDLRVLLADDAFEFADADDVFLGDVVAFGHEAVEFFLHAGGVGGGFLDSALERVGGFEGELVFGRGFLAGVVQFFLNAGDAHGGLLELFDQADSADGEIQPHQHAAGADNQTKDEVQVHRSSIGQVDGGNRAECPRRGCKCRGNVPSVARGVGRASEKGSGDEAVPM